MHLGGMLHHDKLICPHRAGPNVSYFPGLYEVMKCFHGFFNGYVLVEAVDLQKVKIVGIEAFQRGIDGGEDGLAGKS